jgi:hypothetical protein
MLLNVRAQTKAESIAVAPAFDAAGDDYAHVALGDDHPVMLLLDLRQHYPSERWPWCAVGTEAYRTDVDSLEQAEAAVGDLAERHLAGDPTVHEIFVVVVVAETLDDDGDGLGWTAEWLLNPDGTLGKRAEEVSLSLGGSIWQQMATALASVEPT